MTLTTLSSGGTGSSVAIYTTSSSTTWTTAVSTNSITCSDPETSYVRQGLADILYTHGVEIAPGILLKLDKQTRKPKWEVSQGKKIFSLENDFPKVVQIVDGPVEFDEIQFNKKSVIRLPDGRVLQAHREDGLTIQELVGAAKKKNINVKGNRTLYESLAYCHFNDIAIPKGSLGCTLTLPNGTTINVKSDDSVDVCDRDAKVIYKSAPTRNFNQYLNASDLLEEFIGYCKQQGISQRQFDKLPVTMFIMWLIVRTAEQDQDDPGESLPLLTTTVKQTKAHTHRCRCCGKFLTRKFEDNQIAFCSSSHMDRYLDRINTSS